jgi:hypothetical protein
MLKNHLNLKLLGKLSGYNLYYLNILNPQSFKTI